MRILIIVIKNSYYQLLSVNRHSNGTDFNINRECLIDSSQNVPDEMKIPTITSANDGTKSNSHHKKWKI